MGRNTPLFTRGVADVVLSQNVIVKPFTQYEVSFRTSVGTTSPTVAGSSATITVGDTTMCC